MDILSIILVKRFSVRIGTTVLMFNVGVLTLSAFLFSLEPVLYTLIFMYVTSRMVDIVVTGFSKRKAVMIISAHWEALSQMIMNQLKRGGHPDSWGGRVLGAA